MITYSEYKEAATELKRRKDQFNKENADLIEKSYNRFGWVLKVIGSGLVREDTEHITWIEELKGSVKYIVKAFDKDYERYYVRTVYVSFSYIDKIVEELHKYGEKYLRDKFNH